MTLHGTGCERCGSTTGATGCAYTEEGAWVCDDCMYDIECEQREIGDDPELDGQFEYDDYDVNTSTETEEQST